MTQAAKGISSSNTAVLTVFDGVRDTDAERAEVFEAKSFEDLRDYLARPPTVLAKKNEAPFIVPARCRGGRKKENVDARRVLVLDVDKSALSASDAAELLGDLLDVDFVLHTTHSHGLTDGRHSYRIWLNYVAESAAEIEAVTRHAFGLLGLDPTPESWRSLGFFGPAVHPDRRDRFEIYSAVSETPLPGRWTPSADTGGRRPSPSVDDPPDVDIEEVRDALRCVTDDNGSRERWLTIGMALHSTAHPEARSIWDEWSARQESGKYDPADQERTWESFFSDGNAAGRVGVGTIFHLARRGGWRINPRTNAVNDFADVGGDANLDRTDAIFAARIVADHRDQLRFVETLASWIRFDGRRWRMDRGLAARELAMEAGRAIALEVGSRFPNVAGPELTWARRCNSAAGIKAAIELAQPKLNVVASKLDADRMVLNLQNGTLDLGTHQLRPHDPADLITKVAPTRYRPDSRCERWDRFLREVLPDEAMRTFFQLAMGYALQGGQEAKVFFVVHGPPDGGKSTALNACARALGTSVRSDKATGDDDSAVVTRFYAENTGMATFATVRYGGGNRPELAKLMGARVVIVNEIKADLLESSIVKAWTGGDQVSATPKYAHPLSFYADGTIFFVGNELPAIDFADDAMWERAVILPFTQSIPPERRIRNLIGLFDLDAVMAWMIEGHRIYREEGRLNPPEAARLARDAHRAESDPLADFWAAKVRVAEEVDSTGSPPCVNRQEMYQAYDRWCLTAGVPPRERISQAALTRYVNRRAAGPERFAEKKRSGVRGWEGISLADGDDDQDDDVPF